MAIWETATSDDYVDDSEPERKRIRLETAETKKRRTQSSNTIVTVGSPPFSRAPKPHHSVRGDITDISEEPKGVAAEVIPDSVESIVIDTIGDTTRNDAKLPSESSQQQAPTSPLEATHASTPHRVSSSDSIGIHNVSSESNLMTCLGHLAYRQVRASNDASTSSRPASDRTTSTYQIHNGKAKKRSKEPLPDSDVAKLDVGRLRRCVSCEARWTVHKGTSHKLSHITTCAQKKGINSDTLRRLIEGELLKMGGARKNDKGTASCSAEATPQTYMESVVAEAQPRRKQRRSDTASTLQPISQTRAAILDRAKALLRTGEAVPCDAPELEQTQAFGRSKLASKHVQVENINPIVTHPSEEECALTSRLALLRSMAGSPTAPPLQRAG